jgi:hypothetical protein
MSPTKPAVIEWLSGRAMLVIAAAFACSRG